MGDLLRVRDEQASIAAPPCPQCGVQLVGSTSDWWQCAAVHCPYEMPDEAYRLYVSLCALFESAPEKFFELVRGHHDEVRALEPAWLR
ncbi:hypothetical protein [Streptomyces sioyaensis]|uniref:hypothetical protein n=1 Tax=Streptomyces sioyaensis TaxID=67364 RepID=UPI00378B5A47